MVYILDTDVFIQAKNLHYGFDFCPAFWEWLIVKNGKGLVFSIEKVGDEIESGGDELSKWAIDRGNGFFLALDSPTIASLNTISNWVISQGFHQAAISTFFQGADYYLIAFCHAHKYDLVTHEVPVTSVKRIKIPNVCIGLGIKCMNPYEMLRKERARFVLGPSP